mmetsp:Transcript_42125/g.63613  ORF Transcript_42125/g.63613 Transcript_42125/m.63613 type:complete len:154 (+) Transcript_42125:643-1104(+)
MNGNSSSHRRRSDLMSISLLVLSALCSNDRKPRIHLSSRIKYNVHKRFGRQKKFVFRLWVPPCQILLYHHNTQSHSRKKVGKKKNKAFRFRLPATFTSASSWRNDINYYTYQLVNNFSWFDRVECINKCKLSYDPAISHGGTSSALPVTMERF